TTTQAPRAPASCATARPSPADAPVMTTTCLESGFFRAMTKALPERETTENALRSGHAECRPSRDRLPASARTPLVWREAPAGDRPFTRHRHAGVQGLHQ